MGHPVGLKKFYASFFLQATAGKITKVILGVLTQKETEYAA